MKEQAEGSGAGERAPLRLRLEPLELSALDRLDTEALVLMPCREDRPLVGAAGWCDWRLCGRLSRLIEEGWYQPRRHEALLTDSAGRIGPPRVLLLGQGSRSALDATALRRSAQHLAEVIRRAGWQSLACEIPGVEPGPLSAPEALSAFLGELADRLPGRSVVLFCPHRRFQEFAEEVARDLPGVRLEKRG